MFYAMWRFVENFLDRQEASGGVETSKKSATEEDKDLSPEELFFKEFQEYLHVLPTGFGKSNR